MRYFLYSMIIVLSACVPPPDFGSAPEACERQEYRGAFVLNEGVWTQNNASLDLLLEEGEGNRCTGLFSQVNGKPLGDTGNSVYLDADTLFVVINQSRLVYKLQLPELTILGELRLPAGASPREMVRLSADRAWLTSLTDNHLYRFDPRSMAMSEDPIWVENAMEDIKIASGKAFVSCGNYAFPNRNNKLAVIDLAADTVADYLELPVDNPGRILIQDDRLFVLCQGSFDPSQGGSALVEVDIPSLSITRSLGFASNSYEMEAVPGAILVLGDSGIARVDLASWQTDGAYLPKHRLTDNRYDLLYDLSYDKEKGELYVSNARYGGVGGEVLRLDPFLNVVQRWEVGLYPGEVFFYR